MRIDVTLTLDDAERERLASETTWPIEEVDQRLTNYSKAAIQELADMLNGEANLDRASDIREHRLMLLIVHGGGGIPSEAGVARMFHMTLSAARNLIRRVHSRYRAQIREARREALANVLSACRSDDKKTTYLVVIEDRLMVESINEELAALSLGTDVYTRLVSHDAERVEYKMSARSFDALKKALGK